MEQEQEKPKTKVRSICVDTLTGIQTEMYMTSVKKPTHDKWRDWGVDIWSFNSDLQNMGFNTILVLGEPGTGKSTSMRNLPHKSNIWFNADKKDPVWLGGREEYGTKRKPNYPYHMIPKTYKEIIDHIAKALEAGAFEEDRFAFLTGHTEEFKKGNDVRYRLKTIGNVTTKMQLEGKFETVLYTRAMRDGSSTKYVFETENDGFNTVRSPQGLFDPIIENDYNFVLQKLLNY